MTMHNGAHLALSRANFEPIAQFLRQLDGEVLVGQSTPCEVALTSEMRAVAARTHDVSYVVRHPAGKSMMLRFTMVGDAADRILFQVQHRSAKGGEGFTGGTLDQHVYRLEEMEELKRSITKTVIVFLAG